MTVEGKVVLVTGGGRGLGAAYVAALVQAGARVVAVARGFADPVAARALPGENGAVERWACDLHDEAQIVDVVERAARAFGVIDVLVKNAGVFPHHPTLAVSVADWDHVMAVNVRALYLMIREVAPRMIDNGSGNIINISTVSASHTDRGASAHEGLLAYNVSKAAVERMTDYLAEDLAPLGIAVNALRPGPVLTEGWREVDPAAYGAAIRSGRGITCSPLTVGPPLLHLAEQTAATLTGRVLSATQFGISWP